jgi:hypothetical protein
MLKAKSSQESFYGRGQVKGQAYGSYLNSKNG